MRESLAGLPVDPLVQTPAHEPERRPVDVNWGNNATCRGANLEETILDFRYPGEPRSWAVTLVSVPAGATFRVRIGCGGGFREVPAAVAGQYITHGSDIQIFGSGPLGHVLTAQISHGQGVPNL